MLCRDYPSGRRCEYQLSLPPKWLVYENAPPSFVSLKSTFRNVAGFLSAICCAAPRSSLPLQRRSRYPTQSRGPARPSAPCCARRPHARAILGSAGSSSSSARVPLLSTERQRRGAHCALGTAEDVNASAEATRSGTGSAAGALEEDGITAVVTALASLLEEFCLMVQRAVRWRRLLALGRHCVLALGVALLLPSAALHLSRRSGGTCVSRKGAPRSRAERRAARRSRGHGKGPLAVGPGCIAAAACLALALGPSFAGAQQPDFTNCKSPTNMFSVSGSLRSSPCATNTLSVISAGGGQFLWACEMGDAMLSDGDGSGPGPASSRSVGMLGCSVVFDLALSAARDALYAACGMQVRRCAWDAAAGAASGCAVLAGAYCPPRGSLNGVALQGGALVLGCFGGSTAADAGVLICPLAAGGAALNGSCAKHGQDPCGRATGRSSFKNNALSLGAQGGLTVGCANDGAAYCSAFSTAAGPSGCAATAQAPPCYQDTMGIARLPSGQTAVSCYSQGVLLCSSRHPSAAPSAAPSDSPSAPPTAGPTGAPTALPSGAPSGLPSAAPSGQPSGMPSAAPSGPPSAGPSSAPTSAPTLLPSGNPSGPPSVPPSLNPSAAPSPQLSPQPSAPPSAGPSQPPTRAPTARPATPPTARPTAPPSARPSTPPTGPPTQRPSGALSPVPSAAPSARPAGPPTLAPSLPPTADGSQCPAGHYRNQSGECELCSAEKVQGGCPPEEGGFPAPSADGSACLCSCRFYWVGAACSRCPAGYGGLDCDRCAVGGAEPPQCAPPQCADLASLPGETVTECGGGAREIALQPALHHKGIPATITIVPLSPPQRLSLPAHVPAQQLGGGALSVQGAELQLSQWLQLRVLPAAALTHTAPIALSINVTGVGCLPVSAQLTISCPAPQPRVSGSLPSAALPEGGELAVPCALSELAHVSYPFSVRSSPPGVISYSNSTGLCTVRAAGLPSPPPENGTTAVLTVVAPGAEVPLPLHIEVNPPICSSRMRGPLYIQLPPSGKGYESVGSISLADLPGSAQGFGLVGETRGTRVRSQLGDELRVTVSHEASEATFYARLFYSVSGVRCVEAQPVHTFWGPGIAGSLDHLRWPILRPFAHTLQTRAIASIGSPPWCPEPVLRIAQQPGGLELSHRSNEWVLSGSVSTPGLHLAYITATDCRGGSARIRVELYGIAGTELGPLPDTTYLEDTPLPLPLPSVLSTAKELTLSVAPQLDAQLHMGLLSANCAQGVNISQAEPGLALALGGSPEELRHCKVTLTPSPNGCETLRLVWRAAGQAQGQLLSAVCGPDLPVATPVKRLVRWGDNIDVQIFTLVYSVDHDKCLNITTAPNKTEVWLHKEGAAVTGRAPREEVSECRVLNVYTCRTNLGVSTSFCASSLPDARLLLAPAVIECVEDADCWLYGNMSMQPTGITRNDTPLSLVFSSYPSVLRELRFDAPPAHDPVVRFSGQGEVRAEDSFERLWPYMTKARVVVAPDFDDTMQITVRGAVGTAIGEAGPLTIRFIPVNDAPRCKNSCAKIEISCGLADGDKVDLDEQYEDIDSKQLGYGANATSFGVQVVGSVLMCSSFIALIVFFGIPMSGSANVYAKDPDGAVSPVTKVEVTYELTDTETIVSVTLTVVFSIYGTFHLLFRPGALSAMRNRRRLIGGGSRPGKMVSRIGREAAAELRDAQIADVDVFKAGWGLWWICDHGGITNLAAGVKEGEIAVHDCGGNFAILVQPESAFDAGFPVLCAVLSVKRLSLGGATKLSVLHADPEAELRLCLRLRHQGDEKAAIVWAAGIARCVAAAVGSGPEIVEYTGTAQQLTEFAHMQRVVGPAGCKSELVWTLHEGKSDRALLGGAVPVGQPAEVEGAFCGGDEAASPKAAGPAAAAAAGSAGTTDALSAPLIPMQQQQGGPATRPRIQPNFRRPATKLELRELSQKVEQMKQNEHQMKEQINQNEQRVEQRIQEKELQMKQQVQELREEMEKRLAKKSEQLPGAQRVNFHQLRGGGRGSTPPQPLLPPRPRSHAPAGGGPLRPELGPSVPGPRFQGGGGPLTVTPATPQLPRAPPGQPPNRASPPRAPQQSPSRSAISRTQQGGGGQRGRSGYTSE